MTTPKFATTAEHILALRGQMKVLEVDAFVVPRFDAHQGEYIAAHDERLRFLTGFSGSAGIAIVTHDTVAMFVDGRYSVQVREECAGEMFSHYHLFDSPPETWLTQHLPAGSRVGFDPMHLPPVWFDRFANAAAPSGTTIQPVFANPIDTIWNEQPPKPVGQVVTMPLQFAGRGFDDKLAALIDIMTQQDVHFHVETQPDNIAWFLNVRGDDVAFLPVPLSFMIVARTGVVSWFIAPEKLNQDVKDALPDMVHCLDPDAFLHALRDATSDSVRVSIDPDFSPVAVRSALEDKGANIQVQRSPLTLTKMIKNPTELEGLRACHIEDGVAVTEFSAWLIDQVPKQAAIGMPLTERDAEAKILALRQAHASYLGDSFNAISAAAGNAAMCHYATSENSNAPILPTAAYLLDSGGQYETGTTDITRSFTFGTLPQGYAKAYTAVFKGFHALCTLQFPRGTQGHQIDAVCRRPLWDIGLDYDHGTGHGIGHRLSVHEHPQRIAKQVNHVDLAPGMVLSIEPGYYLAEQFGIRIENVFEIVEGDKGFMRFQNLTLAPIQTDALLMDALTDAEREFLKNYHQIVVEKLGPFLTPAALAWCQTNVDQFS